MENSTQAQMLSEFLSNFPEAQLEIRDKLPWNFLLAQFVLSYGKAILNIQYSAEELREAVEGIISMIPNTWKDERFYQDLEDAQIMIPTDNRPSFCGVTASEEWCEENGISTVLYVKSFEYFKVFNAISDLFNRRKMLGRVEEKVIIVDEQISQEDGGLLPEQPESDSEV